MHDAEYIQIPLRRRDGSIRGYALIDATDAPWVNQWRWHDDHGYVGRSEHIPGTGRTATPLKFLLHRELMSLLRYDPREVDHKNLDKYDNRRSNLRIVTPAQNAQNQAKVNHIGRSRFRGVTWDSQRGKWRPVLRVAGVRHCGPFMADELEAAQWVSDMRARLMTHTRE